MDLTRSQIKRLRAEGHRLKLKPVIIVGQKGLSKGLFQEIESTLDHHELIKLRIPALDRGGKRELSDQICRDHRAILVESIGGVIVIYRRNPEINRFASTVGA